MKQISLDDIGRVMRSDYYSHSINLVPALIIKTENGQHLAVTFKEGRPPMPTSRQRQCIKIFMRRNKND